MLLACSSTYTAGCGGVVNIKVAVVMWASRWCQFEVEGALIFGLDPYVHVPPGDAITWNSLPENVSRIFLKFSALTILRTTENFHNFWSLSYPLYIIAVTFIIGY